MNEITAASGVTVHEGYFDGSLAETDPEIATAIAEELDRQRAVLELIASENIVSRGVLEAQGSVLTNKTVEGYPGRRYHGGASEVDGIERLAIERACRLFGCVHANVQPHSGSQANHAVYRALLEPGDPVLAMSLDAGGHLSHGSPVNLTASVYDFRHYGVRVEDGILDYDEAERLAAAHRPKLLVAGGSAYPRVIDFMRLRTIADGVGARLMVDMAHFAGLVAGGAHPSPVPVADVVTTTTYKSLRGARGGLILSNDEALARRIDSAVFPGVQGSPQLHGVAAKAVCLAEALKPEFQAYAHQVVANARSLAGALVDRGYALVAGGTDTALLVVDLRRQGLTGASASASLERAGITCNKNAVPGDPEKPTVTSGIRLGVSAVTTRGLRAAELRKAGEWTADVLDALARGAGAEEAIESTVRERVRGMVARYPIYS